MSEHRRILERDLERIARPAGFTFDDVVRRRDRKRRNQRITAGVVGIAVFVGGIWLVTSGLPFHQTGTPAAPSDVPTIQPTPSPTIQPTPTSTPPVGNREVDDYLLDLETGETTPLPEGFPGDGQSGYAISPDGSEVAYYLGADATGEVNTPGGLFVAHIDGTHVRQIAHDAFVVGGGYDSDMGPAWSPDGTMIAYTALAPDDRFTTVDWLDLHTNVFVIDLASGVTTQVTFETVHVSGTAFSPDGSSVVYTAYLPGGSEVRIAPATGGEGSTLVGGPGSSASGASFSPDGSLLSYICADPPFPPLTTGPTTTGPTPNRDLCLANADGSDPRVIAQAPPRRLEPPGVAGIVTASWSPDGSRLAFWTFNGYEGVYILDLATGKTTCVAGCEEPGWPPQAWPRWLDDHTLFVEAYSGPH